MRDRLTNERLLLGYRPLHAIDLRDRDRSSACHIRSRSKALEDNLYTLMGINMVHTLSLTLSHLDNDKRWELEAFKMYGLDNFVLMYASFVFGGYYLECQNIWERDWY